MTPQFPTSAVLAAPGDPSVENGQPHRGDQELASLAGGLAHEIRNPLSTIRMNVELLREDLAELTDPKCGRMVKRVERIQRECRNLDDVLGAFLQFARVGELEVIEEDLGRVVEEFIRFYEPEAQRLKIELRPRIAADLPPVRIDARLMRQVLMNLALNAQQAMPAGGLLELLAYTRDGRVCLDVIDTGAGIDAAQQQRIFEAFFSTKPGGSGLGLPTVKRIIDAHGGTIECQSETGRGSRFTICLPPA